MTVPSPSPFIHLEFLLSSSTTNCISSFTFILTIWFLYFKFRKQNTLWVKIIHPSPFASLNLVSNVTWLFLSIFFKDHLYFHPSDEHRGGWSVTSNKKILFHHTSRCQPPLFLSPLRQEAAWLGNSSYSVSSSFATSKLILLLVFFEEISYKNAA